MSKRLYRILALIAAITLCGCGALQFRRIETNDPRDYGAIQGTTRTAKKTAIKDMVEAYNYGPMVVNTKDIGNKIKQT